MASEWRLGAVTEQFLWTMKTFYFFFDLSPPPIGLPCVLGGPLWFREYFYSKIYGKESRISKSDRKFGRKWGLCNFPNFSIPGSIRVCTWLCMRHQILNFPQIFIKTQSQVVWNVSRGVLEAFCTVCNLLMMSKIHKFVHTNHVPTEKVYFVLGDFSLKSTRFRSKPDLDPQRSMFNRFRRARALFPLQTLYETVIKGRDQSGIDKNRLSRLSRVRRPRANTSLSYHA